jgi:hypothetical protein
MGKKRWTDERLIVAVKKASSRTDVVRRLGLKVLPGNYATINRAIRRLELDTSHFKPRQYNGCTPANKKSLKDILVKDSIYSNTSRLKERLIREGSLENVCSICGQKPLWNGKPLVMVLDHINGESSDNRIENLRIVCRHCDSQLETFAGRNVKDRKQHFCVGCGKKLVTQRVTGKCHVCFRK